MALVREVEPFIMRIAVLSAPFMSARRPLFAAVMPLPAEDGLWVGEMMRRLASRGVPVENYVAHEPVLEAIEGLLGYEFPVVGRDGRTGEPLRHVRGRYEATNNDLQVSLVIRRKMEGGRGLTREELEEMARGGNVGLALIYYY